MDQSHLILTLAAGLITAFVLGYGAHRLGLSPIAGYLLAGILVGPNTPGFVANREMAQELAEVGVILLMFGVGLHLHVKDLLAVRRIAVVGALVQGTAATALGALLVHAYGWTWTSGIVFGLAISVASTVVLIRVLTDRGQLQSAAGRMAIGWLVMQDILTVFILVLLPLSLSKDAAPVGGVPGAIALALAKVAILIAITFVAGSRVVPWLLRNVALTRSRELFTLAVLSLALGIAVGAAHLFGVSMALGAFLAGMVVGQSDFSARAGAEALPMRDAFAVMFFLSVGMLLDPVRTLQSPMPALLALGTILVGTPLASIAVVAVLGYSSKTGLAIALALAQIGEFSFLLATLGHRLGALDEAAVNAIVAAAIVSIIVNPWFCRLAGPVERFLERHRWLWRLLNRNASPQIAVPHATREHNSAHRTLVVGYGPIGQMVTRLLEERGIESTVIEMNVETFQRLRNEGQSVVHGDANQAEVLELAGVERAESLIFSASGAAASIEAIRIARELSPHLYVVARAEFVSEASALRKAGAHQVFTGEGEVALALASSILERLGATPDQLDETRDQIRRRLHGNS
ncbi:MAG: cation:proton antiporter [Bryobacteraceae bacterium]